LSSHHRRQVPVVLLVAAALTLGACASQNGTASPASPVSAAPSNLFVATSNPTASSTAAATPTPTSAPSATPLDADDEAPPATSGPAPASAPEATGSPVHAASTTAARLPGEPDPALTPGALNPTVTQATIRSTICVSGWTATIRPPSSYTTSLKIRQIGQYGYTNTATAAYEEDHLIALELGGASSDPRNLWPEPYTISLADGRSTGARVKDTYENQLKRAVCARTMTLASAQARIGDHWVHYYYGLSLGPTVPSTPHPVTAATQAPTPASTPRPTAGHGETLAVRFVTLPNPAVPGSTAAMTVQTLPGAVCSARVTWRSGTVSAAAGLKTTPTAGADGFASWTWNVNATTKPGTAKAAVTCTLGSSVTVTATFSVE